MSTDPAPATRGDAPTPPPDSPAPARPVERLFPFVLRSRILLVGRDVLRRSRSKLHFVLITRDVTEASRAALLADFAHYPVVQEYTSEDLEKHFGIRGAKVVGFAKSGLAQSIYAEMRSRRINKPALPPGPSAPPAPPADAAPAPSSLPSPSPPSASRDPKRRPDGGFRRASGHPRAARPRPVPQSTRAARRPGSSRSRR
jgi:hypothetical protein